MSSFIEIRGNWWWKVTGKGNKTAKVPVNKDMLDSLMRYRKFYGLSAYPKPTDDIPLIMSIKGTQSISANMIYRIVKKIVNSAADEMESMNRVKAEKLRKASTHWFRHTAITHQADVGIELRYLNKSARHEKFDTTAGYLHADDEDWHKAMQAHSLYTIKINE
jgi:site-specific recombinase XerD